jgi:hypothetical protein
MLFQGTSWAATADPINEYLAKYCTSSRCSPLFMPHGHPAVVSRHLAGLRFAMSCASLVVALLIRAAHNTVVLQYPTPCRTEAREELRRQMGTLRFDLNTLAVAKTGKEEKKAALALRKEFIRSVSATPGCMHCKSS